MSPRIPIRLLAVQPDERLVRLAREGHERAFEALVHRYRRPLLRYLRRIGLCDSRAEDVLQLVLLNAWLALAGGTEVRELKPWLYRIAHNGAINALRGPFERNAELGDGADVVADRSATDDLDRRIAVCDALADVAALPAMQRQAIVLTAIEGRTHHEVAGTLGVNQDAVRGLLYRARATLRGTAAIAPQPLIGWASGAAGPAAPATEKLCVFSTGGALGLTGALLKGAAVAITAGVLLGGASIVPLHGHLAHRSNSRALAAASASVAPGNALLSAASKSPGGPRVEPLKGGAGLRAGAPSRGRRPAPSASAPGLRARPGALRAPGAALIAEGDGRPGGASENARQGVRGGDDSQAVGASAGEAGGLFDTGGAAGQPTSGTAPSADGGGERASGGSSDGAGSASGAPAAAPSGDLGETQHDGGDATPGAASGGEASMSGTSG